MISIEMLILLLIGGMCVAWWWWNMRESAWIYTIYVASVIVAYWFLIARAVHSTSPVNSGLRITREVTHGKCL